MNFSLDEPFGISMDPLLDPSHVPWPSPRTSLPTDPISDAQNENTNTVQNEVSNPLANEITIPVQNKITNSAQTIGLADSLEPQANFVIPDLLRADLSVVKEICYKLAVADLLQRPTLLRKDAPLCADPESTPLFLLGPVASKDGVSGLFTICNVDFSSFLVIAATACARISLSMHPETARVVGV